MWSWTIVVLCVLSAFSAPALADREAGRNIFCSAGCMACHSIEGTSKIATLAEK